MTIRSGISGVAFLALLGMALPTSAQAQSRCRVMDPTGTPLNVRTAPMGRVVATIENGYLVSILDQTRDRQGKPWVYVARRADGEPLGWVYREFIACF